MAEKVAVVVPVLDEAETLPALLADLAAQEPRVGEIVCGRRLGGRDARAAACPRLPAARGGARSYARSRAERGRPRSHCPHRRHTGRRQPGRPGLRRRARPRAAEGAGRGRRQRAGRAHRLRARSGLVHTQGVQAGGALGPIARQHLPAGRNGVCFTRDAGGRGRLSPTFPGARTRSSYALSVLRAAKSSSCRRPSSAGAPAARCGRPTASTATTGADALARVDRQNEFVTFAVYGPAWRWRCSSGSARAPPALSARRRGRLPGALHPRPPPVARSAGTLRSPGSRRSGSSSTWRRCRAFLEGLFFGGRFRR